MSINYMGNLDYGSDGQVAYRDNGESNLKRTYETEAGILGFYKGI